MDANTTIRGPPAKRHLIGDGGPTLNAGLAASLF